MEVTTEHVPIAASDWKAGRLDMRAGAPKLLFGLMYEDAAIELRAFPPGGRIFCIASAGCTAMRLAAADHPVVAVDINPVQIAYVEHRLKGEAVAQGMAERLLAFLRGFAPWLGWNRQRIRTFLNLCDPADQLAYWQRYLDTRRFRIALSCLFSLPTLRTVYSASLLAALPPHFGTALRKRLERGFGQHPNLTNPYAWRVLLGKEGPDDKMPSLLQTRAADKVQLVCADAADYLERQPAASFDGFSLSNILDGAGPAYQRRLVAAIKHAAKPNAIVVLRSFRDPVLELPTNQAANDRAMLWGSVDVRRADLISTGE